MTAIGQVSGSEPPCIPSRRGNTAFVSRQCAAASLLGAEGV